MEVSTEQFKVMVNSTNEVSVNVTMNGQPLEEVTGFEYPGATLSQDGNCRAEIRIRMATATVSKLVFYAQSTITVISGRHSDSSDGQPERVWKSSISFQTKFQLFRSLVVSILLYGYEK